MLFNLYFLIIICSIRIYLWINHAIYILQKCSRLSGRSFLYAVDIFFNIFYYKFALFSLLCKLYFFYSPYVFFVINISWQHFYLCQWQLTFEWLQTEITISSQRKWWMEISIIMGLEDCNSNIILIVLSDYMQVWIDIWEESNWHSPGMMKNLFPFLNIKCKI